MVAATVTQVSVHASRAPASNPCPPGYLRKGGAPPRESRAAPSPGHRSAPPRPCSRGVLFPAPGARAPARTGRAGTRTNGVRLKLWVRLHLLPVLAVNGKSRTRSQSSNRILNKSSPTPSIVTAETMSFSLTSLAPDVSASLFPSGHPGFLIAEHLVAQSPVGVDVPEHRADDPVLEPPRRRWRSS